MAEQSETRSGEVLCTYPRRLFLVGLASGGLIGSFATWMSHRHFKRQPPDDAPQPPPEEKLEHHSQLDHPTYMRRAIAQAKSVPLFPFGTVIVQEATGAIVAEGHNRSSVNPIFHGEIDAINRLADQHPKIDWTSLVLYTTAEPCPMCQSAIAWAGIPVVVFGSSIPFLKSRGWWQIDIRAEEVARRTPFRRTAIIAGILEKECNALFEAVPGWPRPPEK